MTETIKSELISISKTHLDARMIKKKMYNFNIHETTTEREELEWK
jgi:hypothetical protein